MNQYIYYVFQRELDQRHRELASQAEETRLARALVLDGRARRHRTTRRFHLARLRLLRGISSQVDVTST